MVQRINGEEPFPPENYGFARKITRKDFSQRELEVMQLIAMGFSNKEAANYLGLRVKSVDFYRQVVYRKLAVRNVVHMTHCAIQLGVVKVVS